tara:strand:- start:301 stop:927 length:627 start_codon:yes stop_codon:yes gene_type:complete
MPKKFLKADYINIINSHFAKQGKGLTNLSKATMNQLKELIEKYDIKYDEKEIIEENDKKKKEEKEAKEKIEKEDKERTEKWIEERNRIKKEWEELNEEDKDKVITWIVIKKQQYYLNNYWKIQKKNKEYTLQTDKMEEKFKSECKNVERIDNNKIKVNGVIINNGFYTEPFDWDKEYKYEKEDRINIDYESLTILKDIEEKEKSNEMF